jgi:hypothetical protein
MRKRNVIDRRKLMIRAAEVAGAALMLGGCDRLVGSDTTKAILASAERLTARVQHLDHRFHETGLMHGIHLASEAL